MQKLKQIYRANYAGEDIVTELVMSGNEWNPTTEFVPNSVFNTYTTTQAIAIGNGESRKEFDLLHIARHKGGLFAADKLQTYGCNQLHLEFKPDFLVTTTDDNVHMAVESGYCENNIVYTNAQYLLQYPGKFYLVPQNPPFDTGAMAAYLACFDGHKKVFLLGYDRYTEYTEHTYWVKTLAAVVTTYSDVEFVRVMPFKEYTCSVELMKQPNFRQIGMNEFVREADIG